MQEISIVVTDVTRMRHPHFCVAGWSPREERMVRPLLGGDNWTKRDLIATSVEPGAIISVTIHDDATSEFPHRSEDLIVTHRKRLLAPPPFDWFGPDRPELSPSIAVAFKSALYFTNAFNGRMKGNYVEAGARVPSLIGLELRGVDLVFFDEIFEGKAKLRAQVTDRSGVYDLPVVSEALLQIYETQGLELLRAQVTSRPKVHVRIGLSRPWGEHKKQCSLMLNGVHW